MQIVRCGRNQPFLAPRGPSCRGVGRVKIRGCAGWHAANAHPTGDRHGTEPLGRPLEGQIVTISETTSREVPAGSEPNVEGDAEPEVSVIIPIYNRGQHVPSLVGTLTGQTMPLWEAIIVDDCSSTDIAAALAPFLSDKRFRYLRQERNYGVSAARNRGVGAARGRYVAFLDSDDSWHPEKLRRQLDAIRHEPAEAAFFCVTQTRIMMPGGWQRIRSNFDPVPPQSFAEYLYIDGGFAQISSALVPRHLAVKFPFREELRQYEDHLFFIDLDASGAKYVVVHEPLTIWNNDERSDRLSSDDDLARGAAFLASAGSLLSDRAQTAFRIRVLGKELFRQSPWQAILVVGKALASRALAPTRLAAIVGRHTLPSAVWNVIRRRLH